MAGANAANQLSQYLRLVQLSACRRVLAKGRSMQVGGQWISDGGYDVFAAWERTLWPNEILPESYDLTVSYLDTKSPWSPSSNDVQDPTIGGASVVMAHGTPGNHKDFKYIIPILLDKNIRIVAPNFPGHGLTDSPPLFRQSSDERAEFLIDILKEIGLPRVDVIVGHSAGCYPMWKLAADDDYWRNNEPICRAMIFVNPGGVLSPHKAVRPYWIPRLVAFLQHTRLRSIMGWIQYMVWNYVLGLRVSTHEAAMAGTDMIANAGLYQGQKYTQRIGIDPSTPRVLILYSEDDPLIEKERTEETAVALGVKSENICKVAGSHDTNRALEHVRAWWHSKEADTRHAAVAFQKGMGGHYVQKHQASFIASCLELMTKK